VIVFTDGRSQFGCGAGLGHGGTPFRVLSLSGAGGIGATPSPNVGEVKPPTLLCRLRIMIISRFGSKPSVDRRPRVNQPVL
jgi:hypothetical protein